jgi:hypothetical protein
MVNKAALYSEIECSGGNTLRFEVERFAVALTDLHHPKSHFLMGLWTVKQEAEEWIRRQDDKAVKYAIFPVRMDLRES